MKNLGYSFFKKPLLPAAFLFSLSGFKKCENRDQPETLLEYLSEEKIVCRLVLLA